jgi:hypothetical protein
MIDIEDLQASGKQEVVDEIMKRIRAEKVNGQRVSQLEVGFIEITEDLLGLKAKGTKIVGSKISY